LPLFQPQYSHSPTGAAIMVECALAEQFEKRRLSLTMLVNLFGAGLLEEFRRRIPADVRPTGRTPGRASRLSSFSLSCPDALGGTMQEIPRGRLDA
jgi:hypothetical protein